MTTIQQAMAETPILTVDDCVIRLREAIAAVNAAQLRRDEAERHYNEVERLLRIARDQVAAARGALLQAAAGDLVERWP